MGHAARIVNWNGTDIPLEMLELPAGRYIVEAADSETVSLRADEEAGIEAALESRRQGRIVGSTRAREIIEATLRR